ncbi:class D sortase [Paenibacillus hodogayensis]|uniref:Class D sortase n=1 Tax=Paenibacillus hodogayensis TaxID=279208 RepID=A0ABV5VQY6_9BACL
MRALSYILIVLGLAAMAFPTLKEWMADREQQSLLRQAEQSVMNQRPPLDAATISGFERLSRLLEDESLMPEAAEPQTNEPAASEAAEQEKVPDNVLAMIEIPSIEVKMPVLEGATLANMKVAAAHMTETTPLGKIGNAAIAAHRARTKGRQFNRLNEVKAGDEVVIRTAGETYVYTVYQTSIVEPTDVSVLQQNGKDQILTLITCDPVVNATHRLIVQARMEAPPS